MRGVAANGMCEDSTALHNVERLIAPAGGQAGAARPVGRAGQMKGAQHLAKAVGAAKGAKKMQRSRELRNRCI